ncbi:M20/M25/M40 family metallo-hydrolase [Schleiferilactobacillus perolens]|uniref:Acetylornithine deacetylase succinyl-diaminopimelate desuccinylase-like protein n=1 Tax=Schleiferilactobacillus perolens DSM 12744 TaxID=1423792 RepID=A0A0R1N0W5_9LACO|nr:M20/M25/M40 family metallo-hydrolase [Schleiferilactobacillus perolens]KRL13917.1 acetylornithine deacetylase succinyl-diaminopimelate desuccinylase-like protein [Schleiferilactobacillus perolens DSM 12744]
MSVDKQQIIDQFTHYLAEYIAIPSVSAQKKGIPETVAFLQQLITKIGGQAEVFSDWPNPVIHGEFTPEHVTATTPTILFYNHYDVQPPEPLDLWHSEPFTLTEKDGKLVGRGTADCKGDLIARLCALRIYHAEHGDWPCRVKFLLEGEEEIASQHLEKYLEKYADTFKADVVVWESGSKNAQEQLQITGGNKGICCIDLVATTAAEDIHSSTAAFIEGAGVRLVQALSTLRAVGTNKLLIDGLTDKIVPPTDREKQLVAAENVDGAAIKTAHGLTRPFLTDDIAGAAAFSPTLNIAGLTGGYEGEGVKTVLPHTARAKLDIRLVPDLDPEEVADLVRAHLKKHGFADIKVEYLMGEKSYRSGLDAPLVSRITTVAKAIYGDDQVELLPSSAGTGPMYLFNHYLHAPLLAFGIGYAQSGPHAPNENIRIADYHQGIDFLDHIFEDLAK